MVCERLDLPAPRVVAEGAFPMQGRFIAKPVDSFSGRGISVFDGNNLRELRQGIDIARRASPTSRVLIEHFIDGELYSCSAFVEGQRLKDVFFVREGSSVNPFAVDTSYLAWDVPSQAVSVLCDGLETLCTFLQLKDGLLHTQFILCENRSLIVEVSRRCPGDLYPLLIEYTTGFRYAAKYASHFLGEGLQQRPKQRRHILRHTVTADVDSFFEGLVFAQSQRIHGFFPIAAMGERLRARQFNRAGILFCKCSSYSDLTNTYRQFLERRSYRVATLLPVTEAIAPEQAAGEGGRHLAVGAAGA